jgi:uncharacterized protein
MTDWLVPDELSPATSGSLEPLYDAAAEARLEMPFCAECAAVLELEQMVCDLCGAGPAWRVVEPYGAVHSCTTVHRREPGLVNTTEPYQILDIELASGHRLVMTTLDPISDDYRIGDAVAIAFRHVGAVAVPAVAGTLPP